MSELSVGQGERRTQIRILDLFVKDLGYKYLGNWEKRENSNVETGLLTNFLKKKGYSNEIIKKTIFKLKQAASNQNQDLYDVNREVYGQLRYGINVKENVGEKEKTIGLIDWAAPLVNDFYVAEEVTVRGQHDKRPDVVLYVNGIAVAVLELKRSTISVSNGIRQNLDNQQEIFIRPFFATVQLVMAGNDSEGLRYATIKTPEKYYLKWKEPLNIQNKLDKDLLLLCNKERLLELIRYFLVFDGGIKKICRHNQFFAVKEAQKYLRRREGGIIWHTQGSGKSLIMIWLAKWIRENIDNSRVLIVTDREELDSQIERFFNGVNEKIYRTTSGKDLVEKLNQAAPWLLCSLIHKFGAKTEDPQEAYFKELELYLPNNFSAKGDIYVFVDECHRTQSDKLHRAMKKFIPNAVYVGFTGTPLLRKDKKTSAEVFGRYIHKYRYDEAVRDNVVLDLQYEAREVDQQITSPQRIDQWFEAKTAGLNDNAKAELKKRWGTMQRVISSQPRLKHIVNDVMLDMETKDRLKSGRGNALLVAGDVYQACQYYELFQQSGLKKCAIITSYSGDVSQIKGECTGEDDDSDNIFKYETYQRMISYYKSLYPDIETKGFDFVIKDKFVNEPASMKLLIVVDKLLTGFDAPPATYLYIDKSMQDHGLFQAICRVNRLDGEDKDYGYIVDYRDLFKSLSQAVKDYTSEAFGGFDKFDVEGILKERLKVAKENLLTALEATKAIVEPVKPPKDIQAYIQYFCGDTEKADDLKKNEQKRVALYKSTSKLLRAYANLAGEMDKAGFTKAQAIDIRTEVGYFEDVKNEIKLASGDYIDLKRYEPAMRHLIDSYINAKESVVVSAFDDLPLVDLIVQKGVDAFDSLPENIKKKENAAAEVIENNSRRLIIEKKPTNPKYFERMSVLLDELIRQRKRQAIEYAQYLERIVELVRNVNNVSTSGSYPSSIDSNAKRALYDNLDSDEELALRVDHYVEFNKSDCWRGNRIKEREVKIAIKKALEQAGICDEEKLNEVFELVKNQSEY